MISPSAVLDFLTRPLRDSRKVKAFTDKALDEKIDALPIVPRFNTKPRFHQKAGFLLGTIYPQYLFLYDMGLGKSKLVIDLCNYWRRLGKLESVLVLVPNTTNIDQWIDEARIHAPYLRVGGMDGMREQREEVLDAGYDMVICTYMGWLSFVSKSVIKKKKNGVEYTAWAIDKKKQALYGSRFQGVIYDEITKCKNKDSLFFKMCRWFVSHMPVRYGLTGTPFGRNPEDLWAEFYLVDGGETLGETVGMMRQAFFNKRANYWSGFYDYEFDMTKEEELHRMLRHRSLRFEEVECGDLPELVSMPYYLRFTDETNRYHSKLVNDLKQAQGNFTLVENAFVRLRQLASGYLVTINPEGERHTIVFKENPKLEALMEKVEEVPPTSSIIIFHDFRISGQLIVDRLNKEKLKHVWIYSGTHDKGGKVQEFKHDKRIRIIVSSTAGAYGGNWQKANYVFFYEIPNDPILMRQMQKRAHRMGQTKRVFETIFIVRNSIEEKMYQYQLEGKSLFDAVVDGKEEIT